MTSLDRIVILALAGLGVAMPAVASPSQHRLAATESRNARQDTRIATGIGSGQINASEAAHLSAQQARIDNSQARLSADGRFSRRDYARVDYRQDKANRNIARARNNRR